MALTTEVPVFSVLRLPKPDQTELLTTRVPRLEWPDGSVIDIPTTGEWTLSMKDDGVATLTIRIPVRVDVEA